MGVTGLWNIVQPCARPIKIDTLNKKRLAVDASIWIYQFLKAVRDKEGNALRNSHVVGFFRRICKLLFFGIKPVFVFDGGAPTLKRQTISSRKTRREGRREDAVRTAGKLLAVQMQRRAEEEEQRREEEVQRPQEREEEPLPENMVYVDELHMTQQERNQSRKFKKKDQYHLPELDVPLSEMGGPNDPRVMSLEELQEYARQFDEGEDINVYDFSKIDFNSPFFLSLPATDRYNILNAARLRSRLRMGYTRDQLEAMFPDRMAFSRFQIERVRERNELTQRLMQVGTVEDGTFDLDNKGRVAGEKGREYVLVKNSGVEGGWALGVIGDKDPEQGQQSKPIDVDETQDLNQDSDEDQEEGNGDKDLTTDEVLARRQAFHKSREQQFNAPVDKSQVAPAAGVNESLFVTEHEGPDVEAQENTSGSDSDDEETQLQIAIAMSMEGGGQRKTEEVTTEPRTMKSDDAFSAEDPTGVEQETGKNAPSAMFLDSDDQSSEGERPDFEGLLESAGKRKTLQPGPKIASAPSSMAERPETSNHKTSGPLPFEKLDLGSSLLGKQKVQKMQENIAGGFEMENGREDAENCPQQPPPWFSSDIEQDVQAQKAVEEEDRRKEREADADALFEFQSRPTLSKPSRAEPIDVDGLEPKMPRMINLDSDEDETAERGPSPRNEVLVDDPELRMGDVADMLRVEPPKQNEDTHPAKSNRHGSNAEMTPSWRGTDVLDPAEKGKHSRGTYKLKEFTEAGLDKNEPDTDAFPPHQKALTEEPLEWDNSSEEPSHATEQVEESVTDPPKSSSHREQSPSGDSESTDVYVPTVEELQSLGNRQSSEQPDENALGAEPPIPMSGTADQELSLDQVQDGAEAEADTFSDAEDDELMEQMAIEAEEHARFASSLNSKTQRQNIEDYERELKALRTQQKKDRRDADEVTQIMISECQQLLKLFGLPYITAPMEAEAQCAELVSLGLVDGIVTDDSDIFLFGGTRVYKNMFNQAKFVECYLTSDLERDFDLTRQKLIRIANLLGSDYTEGLPGVGPVTALEILTEFPESLEDFRDWWSGVQQGNPMSDEDRQSPFRKKFRKNAARLFLPPAFPDKRVETAYLQPEVDPDKSSFQWGVPDLDALRSFLMATIGWSQERTDEVLVPVIRDMNRRENEGTQANITSFIEGSVGLGARRAAAGGAESGGADAFAPRVRGGEGKSRRMEVALEKMAERARKKRKPGLGSAAAAVDVHENAAEKGHRAGSLKEGISEDECDQKQRKRKNAGQKRGRKRRRVED